MRAAFTRKHAAAANAVISRGLATATSTSESGVENVDVAIVGGGPVGLALACALGMFSEMLKLTRSNYSPIASSDAVRGTTQIALIEGGDLSRVHNWSMEPGHFSNRVVSITNASRHFLEGILS